jgi:hypothetical protein
MMGHPEGVPSPETKTPSTSTTEVEPLDERVPVGHYINPVRGIIIGLIVLTVCGSALGLMLILYPDQPAPAMGYLLSVRHPRAGLQPSGGDPTFLVEFTLGSPEGAPLAVADVAGLTVHVRSSSIPAAAKFSSAPCAYHFDTDTYTCRVAMPPTTAAGGAQTYLTIVEYPSGSGRQTVTVAPSLDPSVTNPFVVRFR